MLNQVTVPNVFGPLPGPVPLNFLDANFNAILAAMNDASLGVNYLLDTGAANAVTLSTPVGTTFSYTAGVTLTFKANANNTGATTINVNGLGAKTLLNGTAAMVARSIVVGDTYTVTYDGTNFQIVGGNASAAFFDQGVPGVGQPGIRFAARPKTGLGLINTNDFAIYSNGNTVFSVADATQIISQGVTVFGGASTALSVVVPDNTRVADFGTNTTAVSGTYVSFSNNGTVRGLIGTGGILGSGMALGDFGIGAVTGTTRLIYGTGTALSYDQTGAVSVARAFGINGATPQTADPGWGSPSGNVIQTNFPGASATLVQTSQALSRVLSILKNFGLLSA